MAVRDAADASPTPVRRRWSRRGFLISWGVAGLGASLLAACGPAAVPPAPGPTSAAVAPTAAPPPPAPTAAPAAKPAAAPTAAAQPAGQTARDGGTFRFNIWTEDPPSLDPYLNVSFRVQEFAAFFYSRLLMSKKGPGLAAQAYIMEGDLAESWKPSEDGKTWTFTLRPDVKWQNLPPMNGRPLTAQDVAWSFDHFMQVSPQKTTFNQVASVSATDPRTVQFTLKDVYAPFEAQIGSPIFWILPREVVEQDGDVTRRTVGSCYQRSGIGR